MALYQLVHRLVGYRSLVDIHLLGQDWLYHNRAVTSSCILGTKNDGEPALVGT